MTKVTRKHRYIGTVLCALLAGVSAAGAAHGATREKNLFIFNGTDGSSPQGGLVADAKGNLYGTTYLGGGAYGFGNVFELSRAKGGWKETVLFSFTGGADGGGPLDGLVFDAAGNLYGTTISGGEGQCLWNGSQWYGCGVVFELMPSGKTWQEKVLFSFVPGQVKGVMPAGGLVFDGAGNLYGTTYAAGVDGGPRYSRTAGGVTPPTYWGCSDPGCGGTVFELSPSRRGWQEQDIYAFTGGTDGGVSEANLVFDAAGNLYGTTVYGGNTGCPGNYGCGVVFEVSPGKSGWSESVLHTFSGTDGAYPQGSVIVDSQGTLYGTTSYGGNGNCNVLYEPSGCGTVFRLKPAKAGRKESVLYNFGDAEDGGVPFSAVIMDGQGDLLGTTFDGGSGHEGVVYKLAPSRHSWKESVLYAFSYPGAGQPVAPLLAMPDGRFFDTSVNGGSQDHGAVFELIP
ncbi:MAG: choice-of-anchor tandem repeat GloVer-containing protein [Rhizomicrobium sp.]